MAEEWYGAYPGLVVSAPGGGSALVSPAPQPRNPWYTASYFEGWPGRFAGHLLPQLPASSERFRAYRPDPPAITEIPPAQRVAWLRKATTLAIQGYCGNTPIKSRSDAAFARGVILFERYGNLPAQWIICSLQVWWQFVVAKMPKSQQRKYPTPPPGWLFSVARFEKHAAAFSRQIVLNRNSWIYPPGWYELKQKHELLNTLINTEIHYNTPREIAARIAEDYANAIFPQRRWWNLIQHAADQAAAQRCAWEEQVLDGAFIWALAHPLKVAAS